MGILILIVQIYFLYCIPAWGFHFYSTKNAGKSTLLALRWPIDIVRYLCGR